MKKSLLLMAALAAASQAFALSTVTFSAVGSEKFSMGPKAPAIEASAQTRAEEAYDFSYSYGMYSAYKFIGVTGGTSRVYMAFQLKAEDIKTLAGNKVTGFTVYSPTNYDGSKNSITEARFFYSTDLEKEDYTQDFTMSKKPFGENDVTMDTPYTITGDEESLFFGYSIVVPKKDDMYYYPIDGESTDFEGAALIGISEDGISFPSEFESGSQDMGALSMAIKIEGDNLPPFGSFYSVPSEFCLPLGNETTIPFVLSAISSSPISSVDIEYALGGQEYTSHCEMPEPIPGGGMRVFNLNLDFPALNEKINEDVEFTVTKINGEDNKSTQTKGNAIVVVVEEVPVHQTLFEEYTGTWCGYCTRGYAALEYLRENYPEFVVAAFHSGGQGSTDPMQITQNFPSEVNGFPSAVLNRLYSIDPYYGTQSYDTELPVIGDILALNAIPTVWKISVSHEWESNDILNVSANVANMAGFKDGNYKIAYLLVADGLTGTDRNWSQTNYYSTDAPNFIPQLNDFCKGGIYGKKKISGLDFNDVVISTTGIYGEDGSIPSELAAEETVGHSLQFDLSTIPSSLIPDKNKLRVIAAVVDARGIVLNCAKNEINDFEDTGVEGVMDSDDNAPVEFFNINGVKVSNPSNGIFIRRQGGKTSKIVVR